MPWKERTPPPGGANRYYRKPFVLFVVVLLFLIIIAAVVVAITVPNWKGKDDLSMSPRYNFTAAVSYLLENGDFDVDPCEDFYHFACGEYIRNIDLLPHQPIISTTSDVKDVVNHRIRSILETYSDNSEPECFQKAKYYYLSCINDTENLDTDPEEREILPLQSLMVDVIGWPAVVGRKWDPDDHYDWRRANLLFHQMGFSPEYLFRCNVENNAIDLKSYLITVAPPKRFGFVNQYLLEGLDNSAVQAYFDLMVNSAVYFGANRTIAVADMKAALQFEIQLANITVQEKKRSKGKSEYFQYTIPELQSTLPQVDWKMYLQTLLPRRIRLLATKVQVENPNLVYKLLKVVAETDKRIVANYLLWRAVLFGMSYSKYGLKSLQDKFYDELGIVHSQPRWQICVRETIENFNVAISAMYVRKYVSSDAKEKISEIANSIQKLFLRRLENITWMDDESHQEAIKRVSQVEMHLLYPKEFYEDPTLDSVYEKLYVNPRDFFQNSLEVKKFESDTHFELLALSDDSAIKWLHYGNTYDVEAIMRTSINTISISAGFLQGVYFDSARPDAMNFGSLAVVLSHELFHTIDKKASNFRSDSTPFNWWTPETQQMFSDLSKCYINQFNQYLVKPINKKVNGNRTLAENLADQAGIIIAYQAFQDWLTEHKDIFPTDFKFNERQLFWLSYANMYCSKSSSIALQREVALNNHSPDEFRVVGPLTNMVAFAEDFHCKENTRMNPSNKCPATI